MTVPARMSLTNTDTAETLVVQFNPEKLSGKLEPIFAALEVLGASGQEEQFRYLKNASIDIELRFDALIDRTWNAAKLQDSMNFILSLAAPRQGDTVQDIDPPYTLFVWPRLYAIVGRVKAPTWEDLRFAMNGACTLRTVRFQLSQITNARRTSTDFRRRGLNS